LYLSNIYGSHPFYLDTRYYEVDAKGGHTLVSSEAADQSKDYVSYSHGVFLRNAHGQEILTGADKLTWRTIGGNIDLTFYSGPTQPEVTKNYQISTVGLPAMQQYFTFGFHQCRWGYHNWSETAEVLANFEKFQIPLDNIW
jgi:alpha-glucosidase